METRLLCVGVLSSTLFCNLNAADITWIGVNNSETNSSADVSLGTNWDTGTVPGAGDNAIFIYRGAPNLAGDISITSADTAFNPDGLTFLSNEPPNETQPTTDLIIDKDLTLTNGLVINASGSANSGNRDSDRLQIGTNAFGITWNIDNIDIGNNMNWTFLRLGIGDSSPNNSTVLNITGDQTFTTPTTVKSGSINVNGNTSVENETNTLAPQMRFTGVGSTITLQNAGQRTTGTIGLGSVHLDVRSDQTWIAEPTAFISMTGTAGAPGFAGKYIVESIDGGRLDNLGQLNIKIFGNQGTANSDTTAMRIHGGTYGSLWMNSTGTSGRNQQINATGDVNFAAAGVGFDVNGDPVATNFGIILRNDAGNSDTQILDFKGFNANVTNGIWLVDDAAATSSGFNIDPLLIRANGSTMTVGGDILMEAPNGRGPEAPAGGSGNLANNQIGIDGGASGVDLTLGGNWDVRVVGSNRDNLKNSILTMTGAGATFEVADATSVTDVASSSWGVGTFNVGGAGDPASIQLRNDYLNDNTATGDAELDKVGEKLVADLLNIAADSSLDANGQQVVVADMTMDPTATLDLNTGIVLSDGTIVDSFVGLGDQVADWTGFASQVSDSTNPLFEFSPILDGGDTKWQASLVPEPSTYALIFAAIAGIVAYRRRR